MKLENFLGFFAIGGLLLLAAPAERAQALSLLNPGIAAAVQDDAGKLTTEVRWHHHHGWRPPLASPLWLAPALWLAAPPLGLAAPPLASSPLASPALALVIAALRNGPALRACFASRETCGKEGERAEGRAAMKGWIGPATLAAFAAAATIDTASAAKVITVPRASMFTPRATTRPAHRSPLWRALLCRRRYYYARPFFYIPAPFPLGFDFGFGW